MSLSSCYPYYLGEGLGERKKLNYPHHPSPPHLHHQGTLEELCEASHWGVKNAVFRLHKPRNCPVLLFGCNSASFLKGIIARNKRNYLFSKETFKLEMSGKVEMKLNESDHNLIMRNIRRIRRDPRSAPFLSHKTSALASFL